MPESGPARVTTVAQKLSAQFYVRWRELKGDINRHVIEQDALGLSDDDSDPRILTDGGQPFEFRTDPAKLSSFREWLNDQIRQGVVEPVGPRRTRQGAHYTAPFIRRAFKTGARDSGTRLREAGVEPIYARDELQAFFNLPIPTRQLQTLYLRTFNELEGVGDDVGQQISRELASGLAAGLNPNDIAEDMNDVIDSVGITRSRTIARTETARSYDHASLLRYDTNGIEQAKIMNGDPCEQCAKAIAKNPYSLDEAFGTLPIHPNCTGAWGPVI